MLHGAAQVLTPTEVVSNAAVFLFGGIETSEGMTANVLRHLLLHPAALDAVRADRSLVDVAVEESLRLEPAAARVDRYATVDVELAGAHVRAGDLVVVSLAAANRDPAVYDDPDAFRLDRANARTHVAFAQGPHACLGAQLARMETRAAIDAVLDQLHDLELVEPSAVAGHDLPQAGRAARALVDLGRLSQTRRMASLDDLIARFDVTDPGVRAVAVPGARRAARGHADLLRRAHRPVDAHPLRRGARDAARPPARPRLHAPLHARAVRQARARPAVEPLPRARAVVAAVRSSRPITPGCAAW